LLVHALALRLGAATRFLGALQLGLQRRLALGRLCDEALAFGLALGLGGAPGKRVGLLPRLLGGVRLRVEMRGERALPDALRLVVAIHPVSAAGQHCGGDYDAGDDADNASPRSPQRRGQRSELAMGDAEGADRLTDVLEALIAEQPELQR